MPPKTRKNTTRSTDKIVKAGSTSSSDEPDSTKSYEIITRLSQKYLNKGQRPKKANGNKIKNQENGYEGDEENTTGSPSPVSGSPASITGSSSSASGSPYDFEDEVMSGDSILKKKGKKTKKSVKKVEKKSNKRKKSPKVDIPPRKQDKSVTFSDKSVCIEYETVKLPKTPLPSATHKTPSLPLEKIDVQMIEESQRQLRKRKVDVPATVPSKCKVTKKHLVEKVQTEPKIKGVNIHSSSNFIQPRRKIVPGMVQDSSTPNEMVRTTTLKRTGNDSCFGFEEVKTSLLVSPVRKLPITPMSDYASMDTFSCSVSMEDTCSIKKPKPHSPTLFSMEEDDSNELQVNKSINNFYSKPKKRMKTKKQQMAKSNEWAEKMNIELQEIESFELSIEQD